MRPEVKTLAIGSATNTALTAANVVLTDVDVSGFEQIHIGAIAYSGTTAVTGKTVSIKLEAREATAGDGSSYVTILSGYEKPVPEEASSYLPVDVGVARGNAERAKLFRVTLNGDIAQADATYDLVVLGLLSKRGPSADLQV